MKNHIMQVEKSNESSELSSWKKYMTRKVSKDYSSTFLYKLSSMFCVDIKSKLEHNRIDRDREVLMGH